MASPFKTHQEFNEATGAIYTYSDRPAIIALLLIACALIFLYFIYTSFNLRKEGPAVKNPVMLSILLASTAFSTAATLYQHSGQQAPTQAQVTQPTEQPKAAPLALLGMIGLGGTGVSRRHRRSKWLSRRWR